MKNWAGMLLIIAISVLALPAQSGFSAERLEKDINSEYDELMPRFSPDGGRMYFVRYQHPENTGGRKAGQDIWFSEMGPDGNWSKAINMGAPLNNDAHNAVGGVGNMGKTLYLANLYPEGNFAGKPGISVSRFQNGAWTKPEPVFRPEQIDTMARFLDFFVTSDQQIMVLSMGKGKDSDIYYALNQGGGQFSSPKPLGKAINSEKYSEMSPFISQDGQKLIFTSTSSGQGDIFYSERLDDSWENWSEPKSLGEKVNSPGLDAHFVIDPSGKIGYFMSGITPTSPGDLYRIALDELELWEQSRTDTIFVTLKGDESQTLDLSTFLDDKSQILEAQPMLKSTIVEWKRDLISQEWRMTSLSPDYPGTEYQEFWICDPVETHRCRTVAVIVNAQPKALLGAAPTDKPKDERTDAMLFKSEEISSVEITIVEADEPIAKAEPVEIEAEKVAQVEEVEAPEAHEIESVVQIEVVAEPVEIEPILEQAEELVEAKEIEAPVFVEPEAAVPQPVLISGIVKDELTGKPLAADLVFFQDGKELARLKSDASTGAYSYLVEDAKDLEVEIQRQFYFAHSQHLEMGKAALKGKLLSNFELRPLPMEEGQTVVLQNIYFDLDKSTLKPESKEELLRLRDLLTANPGMEIEVRGHTDSQADDAYNQELSEARAAAVVNYLKYQGIMGYRLGSAGLGEKQPIATNDTEEGRALNRRVEFLIKKK